ncbi:prepilin-type N-terminal cleavage/methylation domain-containing protein [Nitrospirillum amazonense]|uniref:Prepilin-type N-terminal cleavage/methylation domain-containing protein n=1 Tax=Nitrospirillum amazonense TaxID=28077 RepID=A0A560EJW3_9PROT|nr:prepilin-type N-terminal cleavage/methylation domain-containing protein [Nitrospirillum amazonense]TWB09661.1 prepilin-type N-terminal cleavage/methylation domain-containing protein [Nitrospirillum amazonense]
MTGTFPGGLGQRGMTLVEALVVLALLGLLALAGVELLPLMNRMSDRSGTFQREAAAMGRVHDFVRAAVQNALPVADLGNAARELTPLAADATHLELLTTLPPGLGSGGLYRVTMTSEGGADHLTLRLRVKGLRPDVPKSVEGALVEDAARISWSYFDRQRDSWSDHWSSRETLPDLVRLDVQMPDGRWWPPMIAAPMLGGGIFCEFDTIANLCRRGGT